MGRRGLTFKLVIVVLFALLLIFQGMTPINTGRADEHHENELQGDDVAITDLIIGDDQEVVLQDPVDVSVSIQGDVDDHTLEYELVHTDTDDSDDGEVNAEEGGVSFSLGFDAFDVDDYGENLEEREFTLTVDLLDDDGDAVDTESASFYAGGFEIEVELTARVGAESLTDEDTVTMAGEEVDIDEVIDEVEYEEPESIIDADDIHIDIHIEVVVTFENGETERISKVSEENCLEDDGRVYEFFIALSLFDDDIDSVLVEVHSEMRDARYDDFWYGWWVGLSDKEMAHAVDTFYYDEIVTDVKYPKRLERDVSFAQRPSLAYAGESVINPDESLYFSAEKPSTYSRPRRIDEFKEWNSEVSTSVFPPSGHGEAAEQEGWNADDDDIAWYESWARLLPQPLVVGYEHLYIPSDAEIRLIGGGDFRSDTLTVDHEGTEVFTADADDVRNNDASFVLDGLSEGEHSFTIHDSGNSFGHEFYVFDRAPNTINTVCTDSSMNTDIELDVSDEIQEPGWGLEGYDNSENVDDDGDQVIIEDVTEPLSEPKDSQGRQTPYGSLRARGGVDIVSHYRFGVMDIYRPYSFYAYVLIGDTSPILEGREVYSPEDDPTLRRGTMIEDDGFIHSRSPEPHWNVYNFYNLFGQKYELERHYSDRGMTYDEVQGKFNEGYEYVHIPVSEADIRVIPCSSIYDEGETGQLTVEIQLQGERADEEFGGVPSDDVDFSDLEVQLHIYDSDDYRSLTDTPEPLETKDINIDAEGKGSVEVTMEAGKVYEVSFDRHEHLVMGGVSRAGVNVGDTDLLYPMLRASSILVFVSVILVFYKGFRSIYTQDEWKISEFAQRFIESGGETGKMGRVTESKNRSKGKSGKGGGG